MKTRPWWGLLLALVTFAASVSSKSNGGKAESWINPVSLPVTGTYTVRAEPAAGATGTVAAQVLTSPAISAAIGGPQVTYTVVLTPDAGATGQVRLQVLDNPVVNAAVDGPAVTRTIPADQPGRGLAATFRGTPGQRVHVNGTAGAFDGAVALYDPQGSRIALSRFSATSAGQATGWIDPVALNTDGTYTLVVTPDAGAVGDLRFQVLDELTATATIDGAPLSLTVPADQAGRRIAVTFDGTAGDSLYVNGSTAGFGARVELYDRQGQRIATGTADAIALGLPTRWLTPTNLNATGRYTLLITPSADAVGPVGIQLYGSTINAGLGVDGLPIQLDIPVTTPGKAMRLGFTATAGSAVSLLGITGATGGTLTLYDPHGVRTAVGVAVPYNACPEDEAPGTCPQVLIAPTLLPVSGDYQIEFSPFAYSAGPVTLWLAGAPGGVPKVTVTTKAATVDGPAVPLSVPTAKAGQRIAVTFTGTAGQSVYLNSGNGNTMRCASDTYSLISPSGRIVVPSTPVNQCVTGTLLPLTGLPESGTYTFYLTLDTVQYAAVNLQLRSGYEQVAATVDAPAPTPVAIAQAAPGRRIALSFQAAAGQSVYITNGTAGTLRCESDSYALVGPGGRVVVPEALGRSACVETAPLAYTGLPVDGTYTFYVLPDAAQSGTGNFKVSSYPAV
ncbi:MULTISPECIES: hypothetical protein [Kitasatospora]|uniref:Uncharacterized protein n=1 Tax=Kitasatospora setae (strain ATCC 33774 / DSM 43861 / JCM 3304 / KCC A-0304 / NBRC 14216 / KM-6054) TaxID=452652 RepID=E4NJV6_KITSK|nr:MULTISPECIES: hypothetical protein [Kitasatospora]BAJ33254.1 hypothetical protein KSE_75000 [Kitasatospora setae KM-6054]